MQIRDKFLKRTIFKKNMTRILNDYEKQCIEKNCGKMPCKRCFVRREAEKVFGYDVLMIVD